MSDPEETYSVFEYFVVDGAAHAISTRNRWRVQKIQFFAAAGVAGVLRIFNPTGGSGGAFNLVNVAAGGCIVLTPAGKYRQNIEVSGNGARVVIEYTFEVTLTPQLFSLNPTVTPP